MNERMLQGERVKSLKEKQKTTGWSIEKMKEKPSAAVVEDEEEMKKRRSLGERDGPVLEKFGEENGRRSHGQVQGRRWKERGLQRQRCPLGMEEWREDCWARTFSLFREYNLQR